MPRDFFSQWMQQERANDENSDTETQHNELILRSDRTGKLYPHVQTLSISDLDGCVALENACFSEEERCTREKFIYRLTSCPELSLGLYSTTTHLPDEKAQAAYEAARAPDSSSSKHKTVLLAHVIATLTTSESVTDASMDFPSTFPSHPKYNKASTREGASTGDAPTSDGNPPPVPSKNPPTPPAKSGLPRSDQHSEAPGHHPAGRTIAIHSVAVLPPYQGLGLGKIIMKAYLQRMEGSGIADRAVLIAHPEKVGWYVATFGFQDKGDSKVQHAGGNWKQLVYEFSGKGDA